VQGHRKQQSNEAEAKGGSIIGFGIVVNAIAIDQHKAKKELQAMARGVGQGRDIICHISLCCFEYGDKRANKNFCKK